MPAIAAPAILSERYTLDVGLNFLAMFKAKAISNRVTPIVPIQSLKVTTFYLALQNIYKTKEWFRYLYNN